MMQYVSSSMWLDSCKQILKSVEDLIDQKDYQDDEVFSMDNHSCDDIDVDDDVEASSINPRPTGELNLLKNDELIEHGFVPVVYTGGSFESSEWTGEPLIRLPITDEEFWMLEENCIDDSISRRDSERSCSLVPKENELNSKEYSVMYLPVYQIIGKTGFEETKDLVLHTGENVGNRYMVIEELGTAVFSTTYKCERMEDNTSVCIKVVRNTKDFFDQSLDEIQLLRVLNQPGGSDRVLKMLDFFYYKEHLMIVSELLGDNLYKFVENNRDFFLNNTPELFALCRQSLDAIQYVHSLNIIHCDIKPENMLIESLSPFKIKIIDFGSSCYTTDHMSSYIQSRFYRAPEVILGCRYDARIDLWSLGCVFVECYTGMPLFEANSCVEMLGKMIGTFGGIPLPMLQEGKYTADYFFVTDQYTLFDKKKTGGCDLIYSRPNPLSNILKDADETFFQLCEDLLWISSHERPNIDEIVEFFNDRTASGDDLRDDDDDST